MKADQACIVIFREKTAFRRYMICLFHVLDRLGVFNIKFFTFKISLIDAGNFQIILTDELPLRKMKFN